MTASVQLAPLPKQRYTDSNGNPLAGGKLFTYQAGTTTKQNAYTDSTGSTPCTNPVILDSRGEASVWLDQTLSYKIVLSPSNDTDPPTNPIWTTDNIGGNGAGSSFLYSLSYGVGTLGRWLKDLALSTGASFFGWIQSGAGAVLRTVESKLRDTVSVRDFGSVGDGVADDTAAFQAAIAASLTARNKTIHVPNGEYKITGLLTIGQGVMIRCEGSQGSTDNYGTVFKHYSNGSLFRWDGSGAAYTGTGGGLENCLILKANGYAGGNAIEVIATSDTQRPGEMMFSNVLGYGESATALWTRGMVVDGTAANTAGGRGVRSVNLRKVRFGDVSTAGETVVLNQVTHFFAQHLHVNTSNGATAGITLKGINDDVHLTGVACEGNFTVVANDANNSTNHFSFVGKIGGTFINNDTQLNGTLNASFDTSGAYVLLNKSADLKCKTNINPAWMLRLAANAANVTGDGTAYTIAYDTEVFDQGNNFGATPSSFTCLCAGIYTFTVNACLTGLTAAHTRSDLQLVKLGSATESYVVVSNPGPQIAGGGNFSDNIMATLKLAYGDTVTAKIAVSGSTKTASLSGTAGTGYTWFSGQYVG